MTTYYTLRIKGTEEYLGGGDPPREMTFGTNGASFTDDLQTAKECRLICLNTGIEAEIMVLENFHNSFKSSELKNYKLKVWPGDN